MKTKVYLVIESCDQERTAKAFTFDDAGRQQAINLFKKVAKEQNLFNQTELDNGLVDGTLSNNERTWHLEIMISS